MSYGNFKSQVEQRGATTVVRDRETKSTSFVYQGRTWVCEDSKQAEMTEGLADGYEMDYFLATHCRLKE